MILDGCVQALALFIMLCSWASVVTFTVVFSIQERKWVAIVASCPPREWSRYFLIGHNKSNGLSKWHSFCLSVCFFLFTWKGPCLVWICLSGSFAYELLFCSLFIVYNRSRSVYAMTLKINIVALLKKPQLKLKISRNLKKVTNSNGMK